jgi:hypothetical protein
MEGGWMAGNFLGKGAAKVILGQECGFFAWENKVADNYANPRMIEGSGYPAFKGAFACVEKEMKERIQVREGLRIEVESREERQGGDIVNETSL